jgi:CRP/FNR family transcriptional regulator
LTNISYGYVNTEIISGYPLSTRSGQRAYIAQKQQSAKIMPCENHDCPFHELHIANGVSSNTEMQCLITDAVKQVSVPDETVLFNKGESSANLFALESGVVKICCITSDGREQIVGISSPGSLLVGLQSINDDCYEYSAVAATPLTACKISHRALLKKAASEAHISIRLVAALNAQLAHSRALMRVMGQKNAAAKIAAFILLMVPRSKRRSARVALPLSRMEIASLIGLSEETVCRQMARLKRHDIIRAPRGRIEVLDWRNLRAVADGGVIH